MKDNIFRIADVNIKYDERETPYLELRFPDRSGGGNAVVIHVSCNLAEMVGGAAKGARERYELLNRQRRP